MPLKLLFVRHAQGTHNVSDYTDPANFDAELTEVGHQQTKENQINGPFDTIYCSPLRRCRSTLLGINPNSENINVILDDRLMEQPCGINICDKRIEKADMILPKDWDTSRVSEITPWERNDDSDIEKIKSFTNDILTSHYNQTILIVSHSQWISRWFKIYTGEDVYLDNCKSISVNVE
jgi:broad specificity phosphatase PhoE